jgi:hypothetical protein
LQMFKPAALVILALACSGCGSPAILLDYAGTRSVSVPRTCGSGGYTIHPKADRLLVRGYAVTEAVDSCRRPEREAVKFQRVAQDYVQKNRPACRITGGQELSFTHSEFTLACRT